MDCELDSRGSLSGRGKRFSLLHSAYLVSEMHPASHPMDIGSPFLGDKMALDGGSARRKTGTYTQKKTNTE
jgi:hypothetical protein